MTKGSNDCHARNTSAKQVNTSHTSERPYKGSRSLSHFASEVSNRSNAWKNRYCGLFDTADNNYENKLAQVLFSLSNRSGGIGESSNTRRNDFRFCELKSQNAQLGEECNAYARQGNVERDSNGYFENAKRSQMKLLRQKKTSFNPRAACDHFSVLQLT